MEADQGVKNSAADRVKTTRKRSGGKREVTKGKSFPWRENLIEERVIISDGEEGTPKISTVEVAVAPPAQPVQVLSREEEMHEKLRGAPETFTSPEEKHW